MKCARFHLFMGLFQTTHLFFSPLQRPVSLSVVALRTLFWAWPSWCPTLLSDCSTYASSTWEAMQLFRMKMSCTGEIITQLFYHQVTAWCPITCLILSQNSFTHGKQWNSQKNEKNPKAMFHLWGWNYGNYKARGILTGLFHRFLEMVLLTTRRR